MRLSAGTIEVVAIEETVNLADALCSIDEKTFDKLSQRLAACHDLRDHL